MLNAAVAESLKIYADRLEGAEDFETALHDMIKKTIKDHKRILFNGNGYDDAWVKEATEVRGLSNYKTTPDCMPHLLDEKNVKMLTAHKVFTEAELKSRVDIMLENYSKSVLIEANTMLEMSRRMILPAIECYENKLAGSVSAKKAVAQERKLRLSAQALQDSQLLTSSITGVMRSPFSSVRTRSEAC